MVNVATTALRPLSHTVAWLVWHSLRVSLFDDLASPRPPQGS
jgi:hypothetical protein